MVKQHTKTHLQKKKNTNRIYTTKLSQKIVIGQSHPKEGSMKHHQTDYPMESKEQEKRCFKLTYKSI